MFVLSRSILGGICYATTGNSPYNTHRHTCPQSYLNMPSKGKLHKELARNRSQGILRWRASEARVISTHKTLPGLLLAQVREAGTGESGPVT